MKKRFVPTQLVTALALVATGACAQFETSRDVLSPSAPPPLPGGSSEGPLVGPWSAGVTGLPSPSTCKHFLWTITSQSPTAVTGTFTADCGAGMTVNATASGTLTSPTTASIEVNGTGIVDGLGCQFNLRAPNATIQGAESITIPYTGTTCFGNVQGTEVLRRPQPPDPEPTPDPEPPPPPPSESSYHVGPGALSVTRASRVVEATGQEFAYLRAPLGSEGAKIAASEELLLRIIWHLRLAGFDAGRQRNPSGAVSVDKLTVFADGAWHAYDISTDFDVPGKETRMLFLEVWPANPIRIDGIPD